MSCDVVLLRSNNLDELMVKLKQDIPKSLSVSSITTMNKYIDWPSFLRGPWTDIIIRLASLQLISMTLYNICMKLADILTLAVADDDFVF